MPRTACTATLLCTTALAWLASGVAYAENPHLQRARAQKMALEYEPALESLQRAVATGDNDASALTEIFRLRGEIQAGLGRDQDATDSFRQLLVLDTEFRFPRGTSPKVLAPFRRALSLHQEQGLLHVAFDPDPGSTPGVAVTVHTDPLGMVAGAAAHYRLPNGTRGTARALGKSTIRVALPPADEIAVIAWVFDEHGNRLVSVGTDAAPLWVRAGGGDRAGLRLGLHQQPTPRRQRPIYARWYTWTGAAATAAMIGTYFGLQKRDADRQIAALNDDSGSHDFSETEPIEERGRRAATIANISFAAAGTAAVVAGILLLRGDPPATGRGRAALAPVLTPNGAGLVFAAGF